MTQMLHNVLLLLFIAVAIAALTFVIVGRMFGPTHNVGALADQMLAALVAAVATVAVGILYFWKRGN
jgi:uncharacterized membrane protein